MYKFFVRTSFLAAFSSYVLALSKNSYKKYVRITLMKLKDREEFKSCRESVGKFSVLSNKLFATFFLCLPAFSVFSVFCKMKRKEERERESITKSGVKFFLSEQCVTNTKLFRNRFTFKMRNIRLASF